MKNTSLKNADMLGHQLTKIFLLLLGALIVFSCKHEEPHYSQVLTFDQLLSLEIVELTIKTNLDLLFTKVEDEEYQPAFLNLKNNSGNMSSRVACCWLR